MIFPKLNFEEVLQVDDKTRLNAERSFFSEETLTLMEIRPEASESFIDITSDRYLDWAYASNGDKVVTLRITGSVTAATEYTYDLTVLNAEDDRLFSSDEDLIGHEDDILCYLRDGKNSFKDKHRIAQDMILDSLDAMRIYKTDGSKFLKEDIADLDEVKKWSKYLVLSMIFEGLSNAVDDVFRDKANKYTALYKEAAGRSQLRLTDTNDNVKNVDLFSSFVVKR